MQDLINRIINILPAPLGRIYNKYIEIWNYLAAGACVTAFNFSVYLGLAYLIGGSEPSQRAILIANSITVVLTVCLAYIMFSLFVFNKKLQINSFFAFCGLRTGSVFLEIFGMWAALFFIS